MNLGEAWNWTEKCGVNVRNVLDHSSGLSMKLHYIDEEQPLDHKASSGLSTRLSVDHRMPSIGQELEFSIILRVRNGMVIVVCCAYVCGVRFDDLALRDELGSGLLSDTTLRNFLLVFFLFRTLMF